MTQSQKDKLVEHLVKHGSLNLVKRARENKVPYSGVRGRMSEIKRDYEDTREITKVNGVYYVKSIAKELDTKECKKILKIFDRKYHTGFFGKLRDKFLSIFR